MKKYLTSLLITMSLLFITSCATTSPEIAGDQEVRPISNSQNDAASATSAMLSPITY